MAKEDYTGVPDATPELQAPDDYQRVEASPAAFGAGLAQGESAAGQGAFKLADFYGQVAADSATNNFLDARSKLLYGDPTKGPAVGPDGAALTGPDGGPAYNGGFFGLRGADALRAAPEVMEQLDESIAGEREGLSTPLARQQFDVDSRKYRAEAIQAIGTHSDTQFKTWATDTNTTSAHIALNQVARVAADDKASTLAGEDVRRAYFRNAQLNGQNAEGALLTADQDVALARIHSLIVSDPLQAERVFNESSGVLGSLPTYDALSRQVKDASINAQMAPAIDTAVNDALTAAQREAAGAPANPKTGAPLIAPKGAVYDHVAQVAATAGATADEQAYLRRTAQIESRGDPNARNGSHVGLFQFDEPTFTHLGGVDITNPDEQTEKALVLARQNETALKRYGVAPTPANLYIMHQQGPGGGLDLLSAPPETNAVQALAPAYKGDVVKATRAIVGNGGSPTMTAGQFTGMWQRKFGGPSGSGAGLGTGAYPSTADAIRANMAQTLTKAQADAEKLFPNYPDAQDRYVEGVQRRLNQQVSQQDQQYTVDTHIVQSAIASGHITSEDQLNAQGPEVQRAWTSVQINNPGAAMSIERMFDANATGKATNYGTGFKDYLDRTLAPAADPTRITNPMQLNTFVGPGDDALLTNTGASALSDLMGIRGDAKGEAFAAQAKGFIDDMHAELTFSNATAGMTDPKGEARFSKFMAVALPVLVKAYKSGTVSSVLNPDSPDYLGNEARTLMRQPSEIMHDRLLDKDPQFALDKETGDEGQIGRDLLKRAVQNGDMSVAQATRMGESLGYFRKAPSAQGGAAGAVGAAAGAADLAPPTLADLPTPH